MDYHRGEDGELRLILVGKSGGGKSATGNTILGQRTFESTLRAKATTLRCQRGHGNWQGMKISVVDTPAMFDSEKYDEILQQGIMDCIELSRPGFHTLILVTQVGRFTAEDAVAAKYVQYIFGPKSIGHMIVLFTCVEDLGGDPLQEYVRMSDNKNLRALIRQCGDRFCGFNNKAMGAEQERQVSELMAMVQRTVSEHGGRYYVNRLYLEPNLQSEHVRLFVEQNRNPYKWNLDLLPFWFISFICWVCQMGYAVFVAVNSIVNNAKRVFVTVYSSMKRVFVAVYSNVNTAKRVFVPVYSSRKRVFVPVYSSMKRVFVAVYSSMKRVFVPVYSSMKRVFVAVYSSMKRVFVAVYSNVNTAKRVFVPVYSSRKRMFVPVYSSMKRVFVAVYSSMKRVCVAVYRYFFP